MSKPPTPSKLFLWDKRTLYLGPLIEPITLSQGASTLLVSLEGEFEFQFDGLPKPLKSKSLLIPAGLNIFINTKDYVIANCNLDPLCEDYFYLSKDMSEIDRSVCWELTSLSDFQSQFKEIHEHINDSKQAFRILDKLLSKNTCSHKFKTDPRVEQTIAIIKNQVDDNISVDDLADSVGLSVPRLMQLFKQKTGVPIRRYRSWHRLKYDRSSFTGWFYRFSAFFEYVQRYAGYVAHPDSMPTKWHKNIPTHCGSNRNVLKIDSKLVRISAWNALFLRTGFHS